ncbi:MAG: polysaccharide deacetylase family protein [Pirellulales bacterium]
MPIAVLFYHLVSDVYVTPWAIKSSDFKRHLDWMQENFDIVSLEEAQRRIRSKNNDKFTVAITFDDGYSENCRTALPELHKRGIPSTYFITTDF